MKEKAVPPLLYCNQTNGKAPTLQSKLLLFPAYLCMLLRH